MRFVLVSYHHTCQALRTGWQGQGPPSWAVWLCCMLNVVGNRRAHATCHASLQGSSRTRASLRSACTASAPCASRSGCDSPSEASVTTCVCLPDTCLFATQAASSGCHPPGGIALGVPGTAGMHHDKADTHMRRQNDCPQCRKPMQSRRDCKADKRFDRLVAILFDNVEEYEKQACAAPRLGPHVLPLSHTTCRAPYPDMLYPDSFIYTAHADHMFRWAAVQICGASPAAS